MLKFRRSSDIENWVERSRAGDQAAFTELVRRHIGLVHAVAFARLKNRESAEDLTQEVFLRVYLNLDKLTDARYFATWTSRIARNLATDWVRRDQRSSALLSMVSIDESQETLSKLHEREAGDILQKRTKSQTAEEAISHLPDELREILLLHYAEGMTLREIARIREVHPTTIGRQLSQALGLVKGTIERGDLNSGAKALRPRPELALRSAAAVAGLSQLSSETQAAVQSAANLETVLHVANEVAGVKGFWAGSSILAKTVAAVMVAGVASTAGYQVMKEPRVVAQAVEKPSIAASTSSSAGWAEGHWMGAITFPGAKRTLRIVFVVSTHPDGSLKVIGRSPDEGCAIIEAKNASVIEDSIRIEFPEATALFQGKRYSDKEIRGTFRQVHPKGHEETLPLNLKRFEFKPEGLLASPVIPMEPSRLQEFVGRYAKDPSTTSAIAVKDNALWMTAKMVPWTKLQPVGKNQFVMEDRTVLVTFGRNSSNAIDRVTYRIELAEAKRDTIMRRLK